MNALLLAALLAASGFSTPQGFQLPDGAVKVDDDRYRLSQTWEEALKFFRQTYPPGKFPRRTLHSQSQVRAMHLSNPKGDKWQGANVYETAKGEVRVYVLAEQTPDKPR